MKKVLLFSRDPGGANTVIPLFEILKERGYNADIFGKDTSLERYKKFGLNGKNIMKFIGKLGLEEIKNFLSKTKPDFIITGTSANDFTEKFLWKAAEELKIPSFAILDQWLSYGIRFSRYGVSDLEEYLKKPIHEYLPTKIFVMDDYAKREMHKTGIKSDRIVIGGQPYFDLLNEKKKKITKSGIILFKKELDISKSAFIVVFSSEPIEKAYGGKIKAIKNLGYTEKTILKELIHSLKKIAKSKKIKLNLIIKIHPKENLSDFKGIARNNGDKSLRIKIIKNCDSWNLILASDLVCGMVSMFLIESVLLNKKTLSIQIGLKKENPFILDRRNILKSVVKKKELKTRLENLIKNNKSKKYNFKLVENSSIKIINYIEKNYA
ncbi:MAG: hypothetical protein V1804_04215 [Patescibacteria group bacterium]